jgi:glucokinase
MTENIVAGIDIGGTKVAIGLADADGRHLSITRIATNVALGPRRIVEKIIETLDRMLIECGRPTTAIGIGCGGPLDRQRGLILSPPNLPGWDKFPVVELLQNHFRVPVLLDNDANVAAIGEHQHGAGRGIHDLVYLTISTGIGGGVIIANRVLYGVCDGAGEIGHITILPEGPVCGCGARGCLESLCSGTSIARRAREKISSSGQETILRASEISAKTVAEAAGNGDGLAGEVWDETIYYLAIGIANVLNTLAPEVVILGGGVSLAGEQLFHPLREQVRNRVKILPADKIRILQAQLGGDSGIHGALILAQSASQMSRVN